MKRSFSEEIAELDYNFEIGGEMFKYRNLSWDEFGALAGLEEDFLKESEANGSAKTSMDFLVNRILMFLDPANESHKRFKALLKRKTNPVPHFQIQDLHDWLWEEISTRPTGPLSVSSNGPGSSEVSSEGV